MSQIRLDERSLRQMAGPAAYARGEAYAAEGRVADILELDDRIVAAVRGTKPYRVTIKAGREGLEAECTCPVGVRGELCKHAVAAGLAWLDRGRGERGDAVGPDTWSAIGDYLGSLDKEALVAILLDLAAQDPGLQQRLTLKAASRGEGSARVHELHKAITAATAIDDFVDYYHAGEFAAGIDDVIDAVRNALQEGHGGEVKELAEHAIGRVEAAMGSIDDSDGHMGGILHELKSLHLDACRQARPDPVELAHWLFHAELNGEWETFLGASREYAEVLGEAGLVEYRRLAEHRWAQVPALDPGDQHARSADSFGRRFTITHIMETLAGDDVDAVAAVRQRDLSSPYSFLRLAELYLGAGRFDEALDWAQRGLAAFPANQDTRLRAFLAQEYQRRGRHDEAIALVWQELDERPSLASYQRLQQAAATAGVWSAWRDRAFGRLRSAVERQGSGTRAAWMHAPDHSLLVETLLWEGDVDAAWKEARMGGCATHLWTALGRALEKTRPMDAVTAYEHVAEDLINRGNNAAYDEAAALLQRMKRLAGEAGQRDRFSAYLGKIREQHRRKRNLMSRIASL